MRDLKFEEIEEVNGGVANFLIGGAIGLGTYVVGSLVGGNDMTVAGAVASTVGGAVTHGMSTLAGGGTAATAYFGAVGAAAGGATQQATQHYQNVTGGN